MREQDISINDIGGDFSLSVPKTSNKQSPQNSRSSILLSSGRPPRKMSSHCCSKSNEAPK